MEPDRRGTGEEVGGLVCGETITRTYYVRKSLISKKRKEIMGKKPKELGGSGRGVDLGIGRKTVIKAHHIQFPKNY